MAAAAILVALTSLATGLLGTTLLRGYLLDRADAQLQDFATVASRVLASPHPPVPRGGQRSGLPTQFLVQVVSSDGRVQVAGDPLSHAPVLRLSAEQLAAEKGPFTARAGNPADSWRVVVKAMPDGQRAVIAFSLDGIFSTVSRLEVADALAGIVAVAVLAGIGLPLVRASLGPLRRIEATAAAIAAGDLSKRIDHPREDGEARAVSSEDRMRQFVADASHELRTPLTSVRGLAEFALQQGTEAGPAELVRLMGMVQQEAARMGRLVEDLLLLAQFDLDRPLEPRPVDVASVAAAAVSAARMAQPDRRITLDASEPVIACADDGRLRQVIDNLIGNAVRHTPPGSPVTVTVTTSPGTGYITVADRGPGMTPRQASRVFERFYRTDSARARTRGGTGLGLSIAAALAAAHGGDITVDTSPGRGAAFRVRLPLAGAPAAVSHNR